MAVTVPRPKRPTVITGGDAIVGGDLSRVKRPTHRRR